MSISKAGPILVTGGFGFVGLHLIKDLLKHGVQAEDIHILARDVQKRERIDKVNYHECDLMNFASIESIVASVKPNVIFHTASPKALQHNLEYYLKVNAEGTRHLMQAGQKCGAKAFIYTSSVTIVSDVWSDLCLVTEETAPVLLPPQQTDPYAVSKALTDLMVLEFNDQALSHMLTVSLRPPGIFGKGDTGAIAAFVECGRNGQLRFQIGDGKNLFDWVYVENLTNAHILAAEALLREHATPSSVNPDSRIGGEAFFITNDEPVPFWDFGRAIAAGAGYPISKDQVIVIPRSLGVFYGYVSEWLTWAFTLGTKRSAVTHESVLFAMRVFTFDIGKAKKRLCYKPAIGMAEGIRLTLPKSEYPNSKLD